MTGQFVSGWLNLLKHPWYLLNPPINIPFTDLLERQFLYVLELILGPLDAFQNCVQTALVNFSAEFVLDRNWPAEFNTRVIKLNDAATTSLESLVRIGTQAYQLPDFISNLLRAERIQSMPFSKLISAIWNGRLLSYIRDRVLKRLIGLFITAFRIGVTVATVFLLFRLREELEKEELWTKALQQNNPIVKDKILGRRRQSSVN